MGSYVEDLQRLEYGNILYICAILVIIILLRQLKIITHYFAHFLIVLEFTKYTQSVETLYSR